MPWSSIHAAWAEGILSIGKWLGWPQPLPLHPEVAASLNEKHCCSPQISCRHMTLNIETWKISQGNSPWQRACKCHVNQCMNLSSQMWRQRVCDKQWAQSSDGKRKRCMLCFSRSSSCYSNQAISAALFLWSIPGNGVVPDSMQKFLDLLVHGQKFSTCTTNIPVRIFAPGLLLRWLGIKPKWGLNRPWK